MFGSEEVIKKTSCDKSLADVFWPKAWCAVRGRREEGTWLSSSESLVLNCLKNLFHAKFSLLRSFHCSLVINFIIMRFHFQVFLCFGNSVASTRFLLQDEFNIQTTKCDNCIIVIYLFLHRCICNYICISFPLIKHFAT